MITAIRMDIRLGKTIAEGAKSPVLAEKRYTKGNIAKRTILYGIGRFREFIEYPSIAGRPNYGCG
jgi:hypothetical protein